ncbi:MAG TPA: erythromycin esterase family protein, partial [Caulobacteraceae bacterium]|nr:erythromycin esterase family protein [Caulobacteraceae bacterium]
TRPPEQRVGVYALDVYDIFDAARAVTDHLREVDPAAARQVAGHYRCLRRYETTDAYAEAIMSGDRGCQKQAQAALDVVAALPKTGGAEERFAIERAAATVVGGEEYFRVQIETGYSWNARDRRMAQAARQISQHVAGPVVIWAHNTHVGDARHTSQRDQGELSLGQLLREEGGAFLLGFLTAGGTVLAGDHWGDRARRHTLQAPLPSSHEAELAARPGARQVWLHNPAARAGRRLQRAVGVIYSRREREAHYIEAEPERQFDALVFIRETSALTALPRARR